MAKYDLLVVLLLAWSSLGSIDACSEFMYNTSTTNGVFSARVMDLGPSLRPAFSYVPRGASLQGLRTRSGAPLLSYQTKYGFAVATADQETFGLTKDVLGFTTVPLGVSTDGINEKGLSGALLYDSGASLSFQPSNATGVVVSIFDTVAYSLGNYATVQELRVALNTGVLKVSEPFSKIPELQRSFAGPYHLVFRDTSQDQLVLEYNADGVYRTFDERTFVLTNSPNFTTHIQQIQQYLSQPGPNQRPPYLSVPAADPFYNNLTFSADNSTATTTVPDKYWPAPGDFSSASRFIRLYMLNQIPQTSVPYPTEAENTWSPAAYPGGFPFKATFQATESFLNQVSLPLGVDDKGGINPPTPTAGDFLQFSTIRDHINLYFWYKTPSSPQWKLIDVKKLASGPQETYNGYNLPATFGSDRPWYEDVTKIANAAPAFFAGRGSNIQFSIDSVFSPDCAIVSGLDIDKSVVRMLGSASFDPRCLAAALQQCK